MVNDNKPSHFLQDLEAKSAQRGAKNNNAFLLSLQLARTQEVVLRKNGFIRSYMNVMNKRSRCGQPEFNMKKYFMLITLQRVGEDTT